MTNIKSHIKKLAGSAPIQTYLCKAINVGNDMCDCQPVHGGANFLDVRFRSVLDGSTDGLILKPKKDSLVLIGLIENDEATAFIVQYSEIDELLFKNTAGMVFEVKKDVVNINGDQYNGVPKLKELQDNLDSLKDYVFAMNSALPTAFTAILASSSANGQLGATSYQTAMSSQQIIFKDMENKKVKHG